MLSFSSLNSLHTLCFLVCFYASSSYAKFAKINDSFQIYYSEAGHGQEVILFVPGWSMSGRIFEYQLDHFKKSKAYRAIAIDPRGQGLSSKTEGSYSYKQRGKDLNHLIKKLNLKNIVIVGWSFGTLDMLSYISQYGFTNVKAAVVLDGSPKTMSDNIKSSWAWIDINDSSGARRFTSLQVLDNREIFYEKFAKWMLEKPTDEKIRRICDIAYETPAYVAALTNELASYADYEKTLIAFAKKRPLFVFVRNEWKNLARSWLNEHAVEARFAHMGKHLMFWENPIQFNLEMDKFLNTLD